MAINDHRLKLLNFPEENVSDLRGAFFVETRATVNNIFLFRVKILTLFTGNCGLSMISTNEVGSGVEIPGMCRVVAADALSGRIDCRRRRQRPGLFGGKLTASPTDAARSTSRTLYPITNTLRN